mgnify:CR=1 FL=1
MLSFELTDEGLHILYVPPGYISSIQALDEGAKLLAMSDYQLGEVNDEYRFDKDYFTSFSFKDFDLDTNYFAKKEDSEKFEKKEKKIN